MAHTYSSDSATNSVLTQFLILGANSQKLLILTMGTIF